VVDPGPPAGAEVRLRPVTGEDVSLVDTWSSSPELAGEFNDFGLPPTSIREAVEHGTVVDETGGVLVVEAGGTPVGIVSWRAVSHGPNPESRAFDLGVHLVPPARGRGVGSRAQRLAAAYLFRTTPAHRVQASTDVANTAEQRALEKAGFRREGVAREAQYRAGAYHDLVLYAMLRSDP
jgi:RimJ/RimL family protein N-acetyltransferase